jgi:hypothetical protein
MNYTELTARIAEITENTFEADQLAMFTQQAEQKIYNTVQFPALRKNQLGNLSIGNTYLTIPTDLNYVHSLALVSVAGEYTYLVQVDPSFMREAYPYPTATGAPKYYGHFDVDSLIVGPTPDVAYNVELHFGYYPESIVTAENTWLGDHFDSPLLDGALVEAIRFMKGEEDLVALYEKSYKQSITLMKALGEGRLQQDTYRSGQPKTRVS